MNRDGNGRHSTTFDRSSADYSTDQLPHTYFQLTIALQTTSSHPRATWAPRIHRRNYLSLQESWSTCLCLSGPITWEDTSKLNCSWNEVNLAVDELTGYHGEWSAYALHCHHLRDRTMAATIRKWPVSTFSRRRWQQTSRSLCQHGVLRIKSFQDVFN